MYDSNPTYLYAHTPSGQESFVDAIRGKCCSLTAALRSPSFKGSDCFKSLPSTLLTVNLTHWASKLFCVMSKQKKTFLNITMKIVIINGIHIFKKGFLKTVFVLLEGGVRSNLQLPSKIKRTENRDAVRGSHL